MTRRVLLCAMALLVIGAGMAACKREEREFRAEPAPAEASEPISLSSLYPGGANPPPPRHSDYDENAYHVAEGKRLFTWFNCTGCHFHGGGGIGPPLMDDQWIYGSEPANIFATILEGRPNGMPSFRGKIPDQQVWELVAYVRSMSGLVPKSAAPGRDDDMRAKPAEQSAEKAAPVPSSQPPSATVSQ